MFLFKRHLKEDKEGAFCISSGSSFNSLRAEGRKA
jgi:hypothetical protein